MRSIPRAAEPLTSEFSTAFTCPTYQRFIVLLFAAILTTGRRTVTNLLRTVRFLAPGHPSSDHRVFSNRRWRSWRLARALAGFILRTWVPEGPVPLCGDDTVDEHRGQKVYGKACHRDAVRSTHSFPAYRWGHQWVVLAILVKFPFARRLWALPILVALYRYTLRRVFLHHRPDHDFAEDHRNVHPSVVHRDDFPGDASLPGTGNHAGLERADDIARRSELVRFVLGDRIAVCSASRAANQGRGPLVAWKDRANFLQCHHGRATPAVVGMGVCNPRSLPTLFKTIPASQDRAVIRPRPCCVGRGKGQKSS